MSRSTLRLAWVMCSVGTFVVVFSAVNLITRDLDAALTSGLVADLVLLVLLIAAIFIRTTMVYDRTATFGVPPDRVFATMIDLALTARHLPTVVSIELLAGEPGQVGARWKTRYTNGYVYHYEILRAEPGARLTTRYWSGGASPGWRSTVVVVDRTLRAKAAGGTEVHVHQVSRLSLLARLNSRLSWAKSERLAGQVEDRMRAELEAQA